MKFQLKAKKHVDKLKSLAAKMPKQLFWQLTKTAKVKPLPGIYLEP